MSAGTEVELATVEPDPMDLIATVRVTPEQAKAANEAINNVITQVLKQGQNGDYWQIPGTQQPTLLQPGAETLQRFFGLGRELSAPELSMVKQDEGEWFACMIKCSITKEGRVIAESIGYCDDTERKRGNGPGSKWKGNRNTIIQMATKRAYVNAIKTATGTSNHFTTDMEDQQEAAPAPAPQVIEDTQATDVDKLYLCELFAQKQPNGTMEVAAAWLTGQGPKAESRNWIARQVLNLSLRADPPQTPPAEPDPEDVVEATATEVDPDEPPFHHLPDMGREWLIRWHQFHRTVAP